MISLDEIMNAIESGDYVGFCRNCGQEANGVEPDARNYVCEECGETEVFGAEELLIMGEGQ